MPMTKERKAKSLIPELMKAKDFDPMDLVRLANISVYTAYKVARGSTKINTDTQRRLARLFNVDQVIIYVEE